MKPKLKFTVTHFQYFILKFNMTVSPGGHRQKKLRNMLVHFVCQCPLGLAIMLNSNVSQVGEREYLCQSSINETVTIRKRMEMVLIIIILLHERALLTDHQGCQKLCQGFQEAPRGNKTCRLLCLQRLATFFQKEEATSLNDIVNKK